MKISMENFRKYSKVSLGIIERGNKDFESIYLDFPNNYGYLRSSKGIIARIKFETSEEDRNDNITNFMIPLDKFLLLTQFDNVNLKEKTFYVNNDEFALENSEDDNFDTSIFNNITFQKEILIDSDSTILEHFSLASNYLPENDDRNKNLNAVFVRNGHILGTNKASFYIGELDKTYPDFDIPSNIVKIIMNNISKSEKIELKTFDDGSKLYVNIDDSFEAIFSTSKDLEMVVDVFDSSFKNKYDHPGSFIIDKSEIERILAFVMPFTRDIPNQRLYFDIIDDKLNILVKDSNKIKREASIIKNKELENFSFSLSASELKTAISTISKGSIMIQVDDKKVPFNISGFDNEGKDSKNIILCKLKV